MFSSARLLSFCQHLRNQGLHLNDNKWRKLLLRAHNNILRREMDQGKGDCAEHCNIRTTVEPADRLKSLQQASQTCGLRSIFVRPAKSFEEWPQTEKVLA